MKVSKPDERFKGLDTEKLAQKLPKYATFGKLGPASEAPAPTQQLPTPAATPPAAQSQNKSKGAVVVLPNGEEFRTFLPCKMC